MSSVAIMQPYLFPYIGYFQLISAADRFVVYDNIQYTKKGWINRNRFLRKDEGVVFSLPLAYAPEGLEVRHREISPDFRKDKFLSPLKESYRKAPHYREVMGLVERIVLRDERNLFHFLHFSILDVCRHLGLEKEILVSSQIDIDHTLRGSDRIKAICRQLSAKTYINPIGGQELYSKEDFASQSIELRFLKALDYQYPQFGSPFVPWLSIIDVMMFNSPAEIRQQLDSGFVLI